jgi:hypothetical protein
MSQNELNSRSELAETTTDELKDRFPNLAQQGMFLEAPKYYDAERCLKEIKDLAALAELFEFADKVWAFDIHGSLPMMYVDRGPKNGDDPNSGRIVKRIYSSVSMYEGKPYLSIWGEGWDPKELNEDMETKPEGLGNYYIVIQ